MVSEDFKQLMKLLFVDRYKPQGINIKFTNPDPGVIEPSQNVDISLVQNEQEIQYASQETDVIDYCFSLKQTIDINGDWEYYSVKSLEKYYSDIDFLIDTKKEKLSKSLERVSAGNFHPKYNPEKLIIKFLLANNYSDKRHSNKFEPLITDYFDILAWCTLYLKQFIPIDDKLKNEREGYKVCSELVTELILTAFRSDQNHIKNFLFYKKMTVDLDIEDLLQRIMAELKYCNTLRSAFSKSNPVPIEEGVRSLLDIYRRYVEVLTPFINVLRIAVEVCDGSSSPKPYLPVKENCRIIRQSEKFSKIVDVYDPVVRHSESHSNTDINVDPVEKRVKIIITERKKGNRIPIKEIDLDDLSEWAQRLERDLLPAITTSFAILEQLQLLMVIQSFEYKNAILAIGNKR